MKWPWVPRAMHDEAVSDLRSRLDRSEAARESLTQTIIELKVAGASIPRPAAGTRQEPRQADEIELALDDNPLIKANPALRRQQSQWARKAIRDGADLEDVLEKIARIGSVPADFHDYDEDDEEELIDG